MNNFLKKFIVLFGLGFVLFGYNFVFAEEIIDDTPPTGTILINDGAKYTNSRDVTLTLSAEDISGVLEMRIANYSSYHDWEPYSTTKAWTLSDSDILLKTVRVQFKDKVGNINDPGIFTTITLDTIAPIITLTGEATINLNVNDSYEDAGATALDNETDDLTSNITINNPVNTLIAGTYTITYNVADSAGNNAIEVTRIVIVSSSTQPQTPDPVTLNLKIYAEGNILFDNSITVTACAESLEIDAPVTINGKCAIEQSGLSNTWTWYDSSFSKDSDNPKILGILDELDGVLKDDINYIYWGWFSDLNYGSIALNKHDLYEGEELLLVYNSYPLKISSTTTSGKVGDTIIFTAEEESTFDENYNMVWTKSSGVTITLGTQSCITVTDGTCSIVLDTVGSLNAIGSKSLYVPSPSVGIEVLNNEESGGGNTTPEKTFSVSKALDFLFQNKESASAFVYDWMAIAAGAGDNSNLKSSLIDYLKSNPIDSIIVTDNERRAMALMALGINPYDGTEVNYIKKIVDEFDGTQFGDSSLINDDIFALIVLSNAGYSSSDEIIFKDIKYILDPPRQPSNGFWESIDMTSAVIQALRGFENITGVPEAISKAENYLISNQGSDNGFGNSFSTSWALQSLFNDSQILKAENYLALNQKTDGGMEDITSDISNRIWSTSYAIPAILHKSWGDIMQSFSKPVILSSSSNKKESVSLSVIEPILPITLAPNPDLVKKSEDKKIVKVPQIKNIKNSPSPTLSVSEPLVSNFTENNLGASAGNITPVKISMKEISKTVIHSVINALTYIGESFVGLINFLFNF